MLRTFLALDLPVPFLDEAVRLVEQLRATSRSSVRCSSRASMHVTLRFCGDTDDEAVAALREVVVALAKDRTAPALRATQLDGFPRLSAARAVVVTLEGDALAELARDAERAAVSLGFAPETRPWHAHLTLGRARVPADLRGLAPVPFPAWDGHATALTLYASNHGSGQPLTYTPLARAPLATTEPAAQAAGAQSTRT